MSLEFLRRRQRLKSAWRRLLLVDSHDGVNEDAKLVLADLRKHCGIDHTVLPGPHAEQAIWALEGRKQVWLHIMTRMGPDGELQRQIETLLNGDDGT